MNVSRILLPALAAAALAPAAAHATTYCVHPAGQACPAGSVDRQDNLQKAFDDAATMGSDKIVIRKGTYTAPGSGFDAKGGYDLTIVGENGAILDGSVLASPQAFTLRAGEATVRDLTIEADQHHGILTLGGTLDGVASITTGQGMSAVRANEGTLTEVTAIATGVQGTGIAVSGGPVTVTRSAMTGGLDALHGDVALTDSNLTGGAFAAGDTDLEIANTVIYTDADRAGLETSCSPAGATTKVTADHVTIRGATGYAVESECAMEATSSILVRNSILDMATPIRRTATKGTATIALERSAYLIGKNVDPTPFQHGSVTGSATVNGRPTYVDGSLWELAPTSIGVDAADPKLVKLATDHDGRTRPADGNGDGVAAPDLGALERPVPPPAPAVASPAADPATSAPAATSPVAPVTEQPSTSTPRVAVPAPPVAARPDLARALRSILAARRAGRAGARYANLAGAKLTITWKVGGRVIARGTAENGRTLRVKPKAKRLRRGAKVTVAGTLVRDGRTVTAKVTQRAR